MTAAIRREQALGSTGSGMLSQRIEGLLSGLFGIVAVWPTMMFAIVGVLIIVLRCFQWLKTGVWETFTLHNVLEWWIGRAILIDKFDSGFRGLDKIVHWVFDGTPLMLIAIALTWFAISMLVFISVLRLIDR
jgi:hypothetical protein